MKKEKPAPSHPEERATLAFPSQEEREGYSSSTVFFQKNGDGTVTSGYEEKTVPGIAKNKVQAAVDTILKEQTHPRNKLPPQDKPSLRILVEGHQQPQPAKDNGPKRS